MTTYTVKMIGFNTEFYVKVEASDGKNAIEKAYDFCDQNNLKALVSGVYQNGYLVY